MHSLLKNITLLLDDEGAGVTTGGDAVVGVCGAWVVVVGACVVVGGTDVVGGVTTRVVYPFSAGCGLEEEFFMVHR